MSKKECVIVFRGDVVNHLLHLGYRLNNIGKKFNGIGTAFYFIDENNIQSEIDKFLNR